MAEFNPDDRPNAGPQFDKMYCPSCNSPNPDGVTFCVHCAAYLGDLEDRPVSEANGEDALDTLLARQKEEAELPASSPPPEPTATPPPPAPLSSAPSPPENALLSAPGSDSSDDLGSPVQLADGRVITKASTLAKLEKLQKILGDSGPLTGAKAQSNEVVAYLEKKVAEQAAALEKLEEEKQAIIQEYMADALGEDDEGGSGAELEAAQRDVRRLEGEVARMSGAEAGLHGELAQLRTEREQLQGRIEEFKNQAFEGAGEGADQAVSQALAEAKSQLEVAHQRGAAIQTELNRANEMMTAAAEEIRNLRAQAAEQQAHAEALRIEAAEHQAQTEALQASAAESQPTDHQLADLRLELEQARTALAVTRTALENEQEVSAGLRQQGGGTSADVARLTHQIERLSTGAREQVRTVTRYYERILSRTTCAVLVLANNGTILSVNAAGATMLGAGASDLLRKSYEDLPVFEEIRTLVRIVLAEGQDTGPLERVLHRDDGQLLPVFVTAAKGELGSRDVCVLVLDDASPRSAAEAEAGLGKLASIQEDLFAMRMMIELLVGKPDQPQVVLEVSKGLLEDLNKILETLKKTSESG